MRTAWRRGSRPWIGRSGCCEEQLTRDRAPQLLEGDVPARDTIGEPEHHRVALSPDRETGGTIAAGAQVEDHRSLVGKSGEQIGEQAAVGGGNPADTVEPRIDREPVGRNPVAWAQEAEERRCDHELSLHPFSGRGWERGSVEGRVHDATVELDRRQCCCAAQLAIAGERIGE